MNILGNPYPGQDLEHYQHPTIFFHVLFQLTIPKITNILIFITIDLFQLFLEGHISKTKQYVLFIPGFFGSMSFLGDSSMWLHETLFIISNFCILLHFSKISKQKHFWNGRISTSDSLL